MENPLPLLWPSHWVAWLGQSKAASNFLPGRVQMGGIGRVWGRHLFWGSQKSSMCEHVWKPWHLCHAMAVCGRGRGTVPFWGVLCEGRGSWAASLQPVGTAVLLTAVYVWWGALAVLSTFRIHWAQLIESSNNPAPVSSPPFSQEAVPFFKKQQQCLCPTLLWALSLSLPSTDCLPLLPHDTGPPLKRGFSCWQMVPSWWGFSRIQHFPGPTTAWRELVNEPLTSGRELSGGCKQQ